MTIIRHANNVATTLSAGITDVATTATVTSSTGFPTLSGGDGFYLTFDDGAGGEEIVLVTSYTGTTINTMVRGQQSTVAQAFTSGDAAEIRPTADGFDRKADGAASSTDNALVRYDGTTGKVLQNGQTTEDDSGNVSVVGNIAVGGTVDGRDLATDGTKLDGIEALADVTDEANVKAALDGMTTTGVTPTSLDRILLLDNSDSNNLKHALFSEFGGSSSTVTSGTNTATISGTAIDFTGIPSGVKRVTINFDQVSLDGAQSILVQIGDSGGIETTGYDSVAANQADTILTNTTGFEALSCQSEGVNGRYVLELRNGFSWTCTWTLSRSTSIVSGSGEKTLSAELDRLRITSTGSDNFDSGNINILYEK